MNRLRTITLIVILFFLTLGAAACGNSDRLPITDAPPVDQTASDNLQIYFTNPGSSMEYGKEIEDALIAAIDNAQETVDVASLDFNLPGLTNALVNAQMRGLRVRMVLDLENGTQEMKASNGNGNQEFAALKVLKKGQIKVVDGGRPEGLMHNKFIIVDGAKLFVGSANFSYNDFFHNDNNILEIDERQLIENYQAKFDDLFVNERFGMMSKVGAAHTKVTIDGAQVENFFSPRDKIIRRLVALISEARESVRFMAYAYTHKDLAEAMIERHKAGIAVEGVLDGRNTAHSVLASLSCAGIPVMTDGNRYAMHHKVIIIDNETIVTGSFNFTVAADESNDENILIIHNPAVAALFLQEYTRVYEMANVPPADAMSCE